MNQIDENLDIIIAKIKPLIIPDERKWRDWTGRDFQKFVLQLAQKL